MGTGQGRLSRVHKRTALLRNHNRLPVIVRWNEKRPCLGTLLSVIAALLCMYTSKCKQCLRSISIAPIWYDFRADLARISAEDCYHWYRDRVSHLLRQTRFISANVDILLLFSRVLLVVATARWYTGTYVLSSCLLLLVCEKIDNLYRGKFSYIRNTWWLRYNVDSNYRYELSSCFSY